MDDTQQSQPSPPQPSPPQPSIPQPSTPKSSTTKSSTPQPSTPQSSILRKKHARFTPELRAEICKHRLKKGKKPSWAEFHRRIPHVSASAARYTVKRAVQQAGSGDIDVVLKYLRNSVRPLLGLARRRCGTATTNTAAMDTATMDIENLSLIFPPASLVKAGVPTASVALLVKDGVSTHVVTTGLEDKDTLYQACSISKAITGLAVAKLIDQGHIQYSLRSSRIICPRRPWT